MAGLKNIMKTVGSAVATAGKFVGRKIAHGYKKINPDIPRHIVQIPLMVYSFFTPNKEKFNKLTPDGKVPLVLVHGFGANRGAFVPMTWYLRLYGWKRYFSINFVSDQSIEEMAKELTAFVEKVIELTGEERIDIVAHSMGGVITRLAIQEFGLADKVHKVITMGAPHSGTFSANLLNFKVLRDIRPESALITRLNAKPWPDNVVGFTLWSNDDLLIQPAKSATVPGTKSFDMTPFTHYSYLLAPRSWLTVKQILSDIE